MRTKERARREPSTEPSWREELTARVTGFMIALNLVGAVVLAALIDAPFWRWWMSGVAVAFAVSLFVASRRSRTRAAPAPLIVGLMLLVVFSGVAFAGFVAGPAMAIAATTIVAGMYYQRRGFLIVVTLELVGVVVISGAAVLGLAPPPPDIALDDPRTWLRTVVVASLLLATCAVLVRGVVRRLEAALGQARTEVARREAAEHERMAALSSMLEAQKLQAVGRLAAGIAHDVNNLLAIIGAQATVGLRRLPADAPARRELEVIGDVVESGAGLTRQLLTFGRRQDGAAERIDPDDRLGRLRPLLDAVVPPVGELTWRLGAEGAAIHLVPSQFEQLVFNLVLNARDAAPEGGQVHIAIATAREGDAFVLVVEDDGVGMDADTLRRAVEPLFTTKPEGKGTGLGLSAVQMIVEQVGGEMRLDSEPRRGTRAVVRIPLARGEVAAPPLTPAAPSASNGRVRIVLLVEDEALLRGALAALLADSGYEVHAVGDGDAALARAAALPHLDLVVTDLSMRGLGGDEVVRRLRGARPGLPALIMSGFVHGGVDLASLGAPPVPLLRKPFSLDQLLVEVRALHG